MKYFVCETIHEKAMDYLRVHGEIVSDWERIGEVDALLSRAIAVGPAEMDRMPNLKVIAVHGTGTDGIDLMEAKRRGIRVVYAPHLNANAVAELAVGLMLAVRRKLVLARRVIDRQQKSEAQALLYGSELRGKTCGFIGLGAIGARIAEIVGRGFGMGLIAYDPALTDERAASCGTVRADSVDEVLETADVVCLCLPLNEKTRGIIGARELSMMKSDAILLNTSRGALVDEAALCEALENGVIAGAACDVFCEEFPGADHPLLGFDNFVATPHIGANTDEALYSVGMACAEQMVGVLEGREPQYPVV